MLQLRDASALVTLRSAIQTLHPAYFSVVMGTGITAIAAHFEIKMPVLAMWLTWLSVAAFVILCS